MNKDIVRKELVIGIIIFFMAASVTNIGVTSRVESSSMEKPSPDLLKEDEKRCNCDDPLFSREQSCGRPLLDGEYYVMDEVDLSIPAGRESPPSTLLDDLPSEFSWKNYNGGDWTTPARHQGHCGSCWDFAAIGALEGVINIARYNPDIDMDLSEQYVLSCLNAGGCYGGNPYGAFECMMNNDPNGAIPEWCFPYESGVDGSTPLCSEINPLWTYFLVPILDCGAWDPNGTSDRDTIKTQLMEKGPLVTCMGATNEWAQWGANHHSPDDYYPYVYGPGPNHCVVLVGWKNDPAIPHGGYWICKNSYGLGFGYNGFFNIEYESLRIDNSMIVWVSAGVTTIYVDDDNAAGPWEGTFEHPYRHIQEGIDNALNGDTVFVFNGTYYENIRVDKTINLIGKNPNATIIDGGGNGDVVHVTAAVNIVGFTIRNSGDLGAGISAVSDSNTIDGNIIVNNDNGMRLVGSSNNSIIGNTITNNCVGILVSSSSGNVISENTITNNDATGIYLWSYSSGNVLSENMITNNGWAGIHPGYPYGGIELGDSSNNTILGNTVSGNWFYGIALLGLSNNSTVSENTVTNNAHYGIYLSGSSHTSVYHNNFIDNCGGNAYDYGTNNIWNDRYPSGGNYWSDYEGSDTCHGPDQDIPDRDGIGDTPYTISGSSNSEDRYPLMNPYPVTPVVYIDDDFDYDSAPGWGYNQFSRIQDGVNAVMEGGTVYVSDGAYIENVVIHKSLILTGNGFSTTTIDGHRHGDVVSVSADEVTIRGFTIQQSGNGMRDAGINVSSSNYITICSNILSNNNFGIDVSQSSETTIVDNTFVSCGIVIEGDLLLYWTTHTIENNLIDGRPLRYYKNTDDVIVPDDTAQILLADCNGFIIQNCDISHVDRGIQLGFSSTTTISGNTITDNNDGAISLIFSSNNTISGNTITDNDRDGITLSQSSYNSISGNEIITNRIGIWLSASSSNILSGNNVTDNRIRGISLSSSVNNAISENTVDTTPFGLLISGSSSNTISRNTIAHCTRGIFLYSSNGNILSENVISNSLTTGIIIESSSANSIGENTISDCGNWGIRLTHADNNEIYHNMVTNNHGYDSGGIKLSESTDNLIVGNTVADNDNGIMLFGDSSTAYYYNEIYQNNLIDNSGGNAYDEDGHDNYWDCGFLVGNYWDDYTTRYPDATPINVDGFWMWDTPYEINVGGHDRYPLITPYPSNPPVAYDQQISTNEDNAVIIYLTGSDVDGSIADYIITAIPENFEGTLYDYASQDQEPIVPPRSLDSNSVVYVPNRNYYGPDSFTFTVTDNDGLSDPDGATVTITTNPVNDPPFKPQLPSPSNHATNIPLTADLSWWGGDPDSMLGDTLTYDVYFEAEDPTPDILVSANQPGRTYDPGTLSPSTHYYWQIVARDNHGAQTIGDIWEFTTTEDTTPPTTTPTFEYLPSSVVQITLTAEDNDGGSGVDYTMIQIVKLNEEYPHVDNSGDRGGANPENSIQPPIETIGERRDAIKDDGGSDLVLPAEKPTEIKKEASKTEEPQDVKVTEITAKPEKLAPLGRPADWDDIILIWTQYTGPVTVTGAGHYKVYYYSVDNAGNVEPCQSTTFQIGGTGDPR